MKDRLKYRVWDKEFKEYIEATNDFCRILPTGKVEIGGFVDDGYAGHYEQYEQEEIIVEQCTGFKDKNGHLIYEGDILKSVYGDMFYFVWSAGAFWAKDLKRETLAQDGAFYYENSEIIGNIHENPELIGGAE